MKGIIAIIKTFYNMATTNEVTLTIFIISAAGALITLLKKIKRKHI